MPKKAIKNIGLFGGSFDPVHDEHIKLAVAAKHQLNLDEVWILIDKSPRLKNTKTSYEKRLEMVKIAASEHDFLKTSELDMQKAGRTHDHGTLVELVQTFSSYKFTLIAGSDTIVSFGKWEKPEVFCRFVDFAIIMRPSWEIQQIEKMLSEIGFVAPAFRYRIINYPKSTVSSTRIRSALANNENPAGLHPAVARYIEANNLYI